MTTVRLAMRSLILVSFVVVGLAAAWISFGQDAAPGERRSFELGGRTITVTAPARAVLTVERLTAVIDLAPRGRQPRWLSLTLDPSHTPAAPRQTLSVYTDYSFETRILEGGSGGQEARLFGWMAFGGRRYRVECLTQREAATEADAAWCVPILRSLRDVTETTVE